MVVLRITENICFPVGCFCLKQKKILVMLAGIFFLFPVEKNLILEVPLSDLGMWSSYVHIFQGTASKWFFFSFVGLRLFCFQQDKKLLAWIPVKPFWEHNFVATFTPCSLWLPFIGFGKRHNAKWADFIDLTYWPQWPTDSQLAYRPSQKCLLLQYRTSLHYKVCSTRKYYSLLQSVAAMLVCTSQHYSTTLHYKVLLLPQYY